MLTNLHTDGQSNLKRSVEVVFAIVSTLNAFGIQWSDSSLLTSLLPCSFCLTCCFNPIIFICAGHLPDSRDFTDIRRTKYVFWSELEFLFGNVPKIVQEWRRSSLKVDIFLLYSNSLTSVMTFTSKKNQRRDPSSSRSSCPSRPSRLSSR